MSVESSQPFVLGNGTQVEHYRVPGGGAIVITLGAADSMTLIDLEGQQSCEVLILHLEGKDRATDLVLEEVTEPTGVTKVAEVSPLSEPLINLLSRQSEDSFSARESSAGEILEILKSWGLSIYGKESAKFFGEDSPPGGSAHLKVQKDVLCLVAAPGVFPIGRPGVNMEVWEQKPATDIQVHVERRSRTLSSSSSPNLFGKFDFLPPPLLDTRLDLRVVSGTATAYEVKAGEYIQIIDVAGKQCSDFLAFDSRALEKGVERGLDLTTTRTLTGVAYPQPGLFSKFFDQDMQPLLEVVRDTVGRHDAFALACSARYYEDQGYPGHKNCSDNFNAALQKYSVQSRRGWPAINFFYNTAFDRNFVLYLDEPWSRPGDYVLLRAMKDLVCATSACPDDIDPANGWNPTDIHVRIYPPKRLLSRGTAYRMTPNSAPQLTQESAFHPRTSQLTRSFTEYRNFWLPACFPGYGPIEEYLACREKAAVMDLSALRKFEVLGPDAETLLQRTLTRNIRKMTPGQVMYSAMCHETGGMLDDGTVFRLSPHGFRWICGTDYSGIWLREQAQKMNLRVSVRSSTSEMHNLAVQGPRSRDIMKQLLWTRPDQPTLQELKWFRFTIGRLHDCNGAPVLVSRTGYSGELGYEVWCHPQDALQVWDAIWDIGHKVGMAPLGFQALDMLRIEAGLIFAGYEFDDQVDPYEAGIGFAVALDKGDEFIGMSALQRRKESPQRVLVGLELEGNETARHGDCVHLGRNQVGVVTSGTKSPILRKNIALCRVAVEQRELGTWLEIGKLDGQQKRIRAQVVRFPFYDPDKNRPRS